MRMTSMIPLLAFGCAGQETDLRTLTAEIAVTPPEVDLGEVIVLYTGVTEVYVTNGGRAKLEVELEIQGGDSTFTLDHRDAVVAPDETEIFLVTFEPDTFLTYEGTLVVTSNDQDNPTVEIPLRGEGVDAPKPDIFISSLSLDFGEVLLGDDDTQYFEIENVGNADLALGSITQTGSPAFHFVVDPSGNTIAEGDATAVILEYEPLVDSGDSGSLTIPSNDPDEPELVVQLLGNGGGDFEYPMALLDCPVSVPMTGPEVVTLDGRQSYDPAGNEPLDFLWFLTEKPAGSDTQLIVPTTEDQTDLFVDVAGRYEVQLIVENALDLPSVPAKCVFEAFPEDELHVELSWDGPTADLDLHVAQGEEANLFAVPEDCNYCNQSPDWGGNGTDDDPRLDLDDRGGKGPENINILTPADGPYFVRVHYFEDYDDDAVTATVVVWSKGVEVWSGAKVLKRNEVWDVGQLNWPDGTFATVNTPLYKANKRDCK